MIDNHIFYILLPAAFILGAAIGSFVTVASYRLPRDEEIVFKPSHCPHCGSTLKAAELFPILSWVLQKGRCRNCKKAISPRYPLTELLLGLIFAGLFIAFGLSFKTLLLMLLAAELAILIVTDLEHTIIPDSVQIALFFTGIGYCIWRDVEWNGVAATASFGLLLGLAMHFGYKWLRKKDGLGWADVKFLCIAGIWLPFTSFVPFLLFSGVLGTLTGLLWQRLGRGKVFPFGPALAIALFINVIFPNILQRMV